MLLSNGHFFFIIQTILIQRLKLYNQAKFPLNFKEGLIHASGPGLQNERGGFWREEES